MAIWMFDNTNNESFQVGSLEQALEEVRRGAIEGRNLTIDYRKTSGVDKPVHSTSATGPDPSATGAPRPTPTAMPVWNNTYGWYWKNPIGGAVGPGGKEWTPSDTSTNMGSPGTNIGQTLPAGWTQNRGGSADYTGSGDPRYTGRSPEETRAIYDPSWNVGTDPLGLNFGMPDQSQLELLSATNLAGSGSMAITVEDKTNNRTFQTTMQVWEDQLKQYPGSYSIVEGDVGDASPSPQTTDIYDGPIGRLIKAIGAGEVNDEHEAWRFLKDATGTEKGADAAIRLAELDYQDYRRAKGRWDAGLNAQGRLTSRDQQIVDSYAGTTMTAADIKRSLERNPDDYDYLPGILADIEANQAKAELDQTVVPPRDQPPGAVSDAQKEALGRIWNNGGYGQDIDTIVGEIAKAGGMSPEDARAEYDAWTKDGFLNLPVTQATPIRVGETGDPGPGPGEPGETGPGVSDRPLSGRPQAGRFSQFARHRQVDPERGGPALRELERQFDPLERGYKAYDRLTPLIDATDPDIDVTAPGYAPQSFSDYLKRRGGSLQSARMGSFDILKRLGELGALGREQEGLLFGNVYGEEGDPLKRGVEGFRGTDMDQAIQDAAAAQYGRRGGEFVGGQLGRQRQLFEAQQQSPSGAQATNFFDYIRDKYGLQF